jgi:hypothetical protein
MKNNKQTAVDWVTIEILDLYYHIKEFDINNTEHRKLIMTALKRAKQIEKEQIESIFCDGLIFGIENPKVTPKEYYEQIWKGVEQ